MKTVKKLIPMLLIAALVLSVFSAGASAADSCLELQASLKKESIGEENETVYSYEDIGDPFIIDAEDYPEGENVELICGGKLNEELFEDDSPFFVTEDETAYEFSYAETADENVKVEDLFYDSEAECWKYTVNGSEEAKDYTDGAVIFVYIEHTEESEHHEFEWKTVTEPGPGTEGLKRECCVYCDATGKEEAIEALPAEEEKTEEKAENEEKTEPEEKQEETEKKEENEKKDEVQAEQQSETLNADTPVRLLTYDLNGGTDGSGPVDSNEYAVDTKISLNTSKVPTHADADGKKVIFIGWTAEKDTKLYAKGETAPATISEVTMDADGVTVYAVWGYDTNGDGIADACQKWYTLTFIGNAAGCSSIPNAQEAATGTDGKATLNITTEKPINDGYTFKGWATSSTGKVSYTPGQKVQLTANVSLYAVWEKATNPKTGDTMNPVLWGVIMVVAAAGVATVVIVRKKKK